MLLEKHVFTHLLYSVPYLLLAVSASASMKANRNWCNAPRSNADSSGVRLPAVFSSSIVRVSMKCRASGKRISTLPLNGFGTWPSDTIACVARVVMRNDNVAGGSGGAGDD